MECVSYEINGFYLRHERINFPHFHIWRTTRMVGACSAVSLCFIRINAIHYTHFFTDNDGITSIIRC